MAVNGLSPSTVASIGAVIDWKTFWQAIRDYLLWDLEWFDGSAWISVKSDLQIHRTFPEPNRCKFKLVFDASKRGKYRLTFAVNKALKNYIERPERWQVDVHLEDIILTFDWSDCKDIAGLQFSRGLKDVAGEQYFWFRISRDNVPLGAHVEIDPSLVGTSTASYAIARSFQRKTFYANGLFWVFYSDGINIRYQTSSDGITWSAAEIVRACTSGSYFSVWFDGTYVHYAYAFSASISYRRGTPNADGTITWSAAEQTVSTTYQRAIYPFISVDSNGYVWVSYRDYDGFKYYPYVIKSGANDGTWGTTPPGFPYQLSSTNSPNWKVSIIPLTAGKMLAIYAYDANTVRAKLWDGSAWNAEIATTSAISQAVYHSAVAQGDDVHLVFLKATTYDIIYTKYVYTSNAFNTEITVQAAATSFSAPVLSMDSNNKLYVFWAGSPTSNHIYYKTSDDGTTWSTATDWIDESTEVLTDKDRLTSFYLQYGNYIGLAYMTKTTSPYNVKFAFLTISAEVTSMLFSDSVLGTDSFTSPFKSMPFLDSCLGSDTYGTPFKSMLFSDSGVGTDISAIPFKSLSFLDSIIGQDMFLLLASKAFSDTIQGLDSYKIPFKTMRFTDAISGIDVYSIPLKVLRFIDSTTGLDVYNIIFKTMKFADAVSGIDVYSIPFKVFRFVDSATGLDVYNIVFKTMKFSDDVSGIDAFLFAFTPIQFLDSGVGTDVFKISFKSMKWTDVSVGTDIWKIPFKAMKFADSGAGLDVFNIILKALKFSDTGLGLDVYNVPFKALRFTDSATGADVYVIPFKILKFTDLGTGSDVFNILYKALRFADSGLGSDIFFSPILVTEKTFADLASGLDSYKYVLVRRLPSLYAVLYVKPEFLIKLIDKGKVGELKK